MRKTCVLVICVAASSTCFSQPLRFESDVLPILKSSCWACHGGEKPQAGLDLRSLSASLKGGKCGPALVPGDPEHSLLLQKITSGQMPPPKMLFEAFVRPPTSEEVETIRKWIAGGALPAPKEAAQIEDKLVTD